MRAPLSILFLAVQMGRLRDSLFPLKSLRYLHLSVVAVNHAVLRHQDGSDNFFASVDSDQLRFAAD